VGVEKAFQVGSQHGEIGRMFEIEVAASKEDVTHKRDLTALPRPAGKDLGKEQRRSAHNLSIYFIPCKLLYDRKFKNTRFHFNYGKQRGIVIIFS